MRFNLIIAAIAAVSAIQVSKGGDKYFATNEYDEDFAVER